MVNAIIAKEEIRTTNAQKSFSFSPIRVGISGCGGMMGPYHTEDLQSNPRIATVAAVYDARDVAIDVARTYGVPNAFFMENLDVTKDQATFSRFLKTHKLTVISGPNNVHAPQAEAVFKTEDADKRFVYVEKPPANSLEGAIGLIVLDSKHPGQIGIVSQNRMWTMMLEARQMIQEGVIGNMVRSQVEYEQDWMGPDCPAYWRALKGIGGELGHDDLGNLGKLVDIAYHAVDSLEFMTSRNVVTVRNAYIQNVVKERKLPAGGGTFQKGGEELRIPVGGDTQYHGDDVMDAVLELDNGAIVDLRVSQTNAGHKNMLRVRAYGNKGSLEFNTDNANDLVLYGYGNKAETITRDPGALTYLKNIAPWLREGLAMNNPPFRYFTPSKHDEGWRDVHRKQALAFALYAQLVAQKELSSDNRKDLFVVPTAQEALHVMQTLKAIYRTAANQKNYKKEVGK
ncbi:MAG: Gfo/Idh/MocA family oxidoreductase [Nanoarchaeota archaeon]|nr:Gfo/Idh/MocA family oxidoreductase [Nanoarchaeota archaeon]